MKFKPNHMVSYRGTYYNAGSVIEIDPADVEEMSQYGETMDVNTPEVSTAQPVRRGGRPRKVRGESA